MARGGYSLLGGIGGAVLMMPLGVMYSKPILRDVEDPKHMAETLRMKVESRQKDWKEGRLSGKPNLEAGNGKEKEKLENRNSGGGGGYGEDRISRDENSNRNFDSTSFNEVGSSRSSDSNESNYSHDNSTTSSHSSSQASTSRWEQLRSQRNVQPSSWERIRQDNAREALNNNNNYNSSEGNGKDSNWSQDTSDSSGPILAVSN